MQTKAAVGGELSTPNPDYELGRLVKPVRPEAQ